MSTWSMTAISPGRSRLVRFLVRRSSRAVPITPDAVSDTRPRRRVPMRMAAMVPRGCRVPVPTRTSDGPITGGERHQVRPGIRASRPGVAAGDRDRPVTSVTGVTAGASASRSTATVLADELVQGLSASPDPGTVTTATEETSAGTGTETRETAPEDAAPAANALVVPLTMRVPRPE